MILICDDAVSTRSLLLRERLLDSGIPAAVSALSTIKEFTPFKLIVTFTDCFEEIRHFPYDDTFIISIGEGFVNTALNAAGADNIDDALACVRKYLFEFLNVNGASVCSTGICIGGVFLSQSFFQIFGNMVIPTDTEYMIFKYLLICTSEKALVDSAKIQAYCYRTDKTTDNNTVAVHVSHLNQKICDSYGKKLIKSKRFKGYYIDEI